MVSGVFELISTTWLNQIKCFRCRATSIEAVGYISFFLPNERLLSQFENLINLFLNGFKKESK